MKKIIIHVDMDAFYASVEIRDNPKLKDKPVIIGAYPNERGVVATCNYEARKYGVHSAMNSKEAYKLCPKGVFLHPNHDKYKKVSMQIHKIWDSYATMKEAIALDEAYLDVTEKAKNIEGARRIAWIIKNRIKKEIGLTCSVGIGYSKIAAKTASEEKKPNGFFEILNEKEFIDLMIDRDINSLYTVGIKTTEKLKEQGIYTIRHIQEQKEKVIKLLGKRGEMIVNLALGKDNRELKSYTPEEAKSMTREITFQKDTEDFELLKDILFLLSLCVERQMKKYNLIGQGVSLKITTNYHKTITRSRSLPYCDNAIKIYKESNQLLEQIEKQPIRLIGTGVYNLTIEKYRQLSIEDMEKEEEEEEEQKEKELIRLSKKYQIDFTNNYEKIFHMETLFKTIEYMRKHSY